MSRTKYDHKKIEAKWQKVWDKESTYQPDIKNAKKPFYNLMMFPYPSAEGLHVGNMYAFTGADVYGRFQRLQGYDVFEPIGLDGFGIHSENYALKVGHHPKEQAKVSEMHFYEQLHAIGNGFAWDNKLETYDPEYYKWTQWLFVQMFKKGLAYRGKAMVNFCPSCKTVLADEQVEAGLCERCKSEVERKEMEQWFFKITDYADRLLENIEKINWPKKIKIAQKQWIGKKEGIEITYSVKGSSNKVTCFTTTPVNYAATFIVVAPEYVKNLIDSVPDSHKEQVKKYIEEALLKTEQQRLREEKNKTGVFTGLYAINHVTGENLPIWISDFVLMGVGTGAVQGCPGHDMRDFEFALKFDIPIKRVVVGPDGNTSPITKPEQVIEKGMPGKMINSEFLNGMEFSDAMQKTMDYFEEKGWGRRVYNYHLRDWLISRQRYWGPPIPMIFCEKCKWQPEKQENLPVLLPDLEDWQPKGDGKGPLENAPDEWLFTHCPKCGGSAKRETDVSDTFLDSSWYMFRYPSIKAETKATNLFDKEITKKWLPVNAYIGGAEHAVLHLLYARFVAMALHDWGHIDFEEPFPFLFSHGLIIKDGSKMSKSRGNVVIPDAYIEKYGADTLRIYLMFLGPYDGGGDFRDSGIAGMRRFLERIWNLFTDEKKIGNKTTGKTEKKLHQTIRDMSENIPNFKYNSAIARFMEFINIAKQDDETLSQQDAMKALKLIAPFVPHVSEELYQMVKRLNDQETKSIHVSKWPEFEPLLIREDSVTIVVQVNGKVRATIKITDDRSKIKNEVINLAKEDGKVKKYLEGKTIKNEIFVSGKLINFVI